MPVDPLEFLQDTQADQTRILRELSSTTARIEATIAGWLDIDRRQDQQIVKAEREVEKVEERADGLEERLASLESDRKTAKAIIALTWGAICAFAAVVAWLFPH